MGDYDYGSYAVHRTGVAPIGNGPFYNSLPLWSYKPSMTSSPPSSVIMTSAFATPKRQAMSEAGTTRDIGLQRSATASSSRSMPQESNSNQSAAWYQKTKQAFSAIPAMFEARVNKGNNRDLDRYHKWQPQDMELNPTAQFLSLPPKPVSVFQANRPQATPASGPDQSAFSKPHSVDGINQRHNPSAIASSASASSGMYNPNPSAPAPSASASSASVSLFNGYSADDRSAYGPATNSRVLLKGSSASNNTAVNNAHASSNYPTPRFTAELPPFVRGNAENRKPDTESSPSRPNADPSLAPKSGIYSRHADAKSGPPENASGHRPYMDSFPVEVPSSSYDFISKDYVADPSGQIKFNPLFESRVKNRGELDLSSGFAEVEPSRHLSGQRNPMDGVRDGNRLAAKFNGISTSGVDEKQIVKDAFQFLDEFDE